jgi:hypothetical protein
MGADGISGARCGGVRHWIASRFLVFVTIGGAIRIRAYT